MKNNYDYAVKYNRWSSGAIECKQRNMICGKDCSNYYICRRFILKNRRPPMKEAVLSLFRRQITGNKDV